MTIMNKSTLLFNKYKDGLSRGLKQDYNIEKIISILN